MSQQSFTTASNFGHSLTSLYTASKDGENTAISPISVFICMYMLKHGANGVTRTELERALSIEENSNGTEAQDVIKVLSQSSNSQFTLTTANGLFLQKNFEPVAEYVEHLKSNFSAHVETVAFGTSAGEKIVNKWVEKETNGKITNLIQETTPDTLLAVVNAVYMKGKWMSAFKERSTYVDNFYVSDTKTVKVKYMRQTYKFRHLERLEERFQLAFLPYRTENFDAYWVMGILLPEKGLNVYEFLKFLKPESLIKLYQEGRAKKLKVKLPKVKVEATIDMIPFLRKLGVQAAFGEDADLSGISVSEELYVDKFLQKCYVDIDEEGTEAVAATYYSGRAKGPGGKPKTTKFYVTSPYIYFIYQPNSGLVLFTGVINNPAAEQDNTTQAYCSIS